MQICAKVSSFEKRFSDKFVCLRSFFKPDPNETPLTVRVAGEKYSYKELQKELPTLAKKIDDFELTFVIYNDISDEEFLKEIFRRLQFGVKRTSKTEILKRLVEKDIKAILTPSRTRRFYLHRALFELHEHRGVREKEEVVGLISLNYDGILDQAYRQYYGKPNYCFCLDDAVPSSTSIPLLKLHGSFNWSRTTIRGRRRTIAIIPIGARKTYLHAPYGFIWNRALEVLTTCDTLRLIGCPIVNLAVFEQAYK